MDIITRMDIISLPSFYGVYTDFVLTRKKCTDCVKRWIFYVHSAKNRLSIGKSSPETASLLVRINCLKQISNTDISLEKTGFSSYSLCWMSMTGSVITYPIGLSCEAKDASRTVQQALFKRQLFESDERPVLRSNNGPQFTAHIEAFHRILEDA